MSLNRTERDGYYIMILPNKEKAPYLFFKDPKNHKRNFATYNWGKQFWVFYNDSFDPKSITLKYYFTKIDNSKTILNRDNPKKPTPKAVKKAKTMRPPRRKRGPRSRSQKYKFKRRTPYVNIDFPFDQTAEIKPNLHYTMLKKYRVWVSKRLPYIFFRDPKTSANYGTYDWEFQYWIFKHKDCDLTAAEIESLYQKIDTSKTVLDRKKPASRTVYFYNKLEKYSYKYNNDPDFSAFLKYARASGSSEKVINFFLKAANNPVKRGGELPFVYGRFHPVHKLGMQASHLKKIEYKNITDGVKMRDTDMISAGGMQLYFTLAAGKYIPAVNQAYTIYRENKTVPVMIVELTPQEGYLDNYKMLRGQELVKTVKKDLDYALGKKHNVKITTMKISYQKFYRLSPNSRIWVYMNGVEKQVAAKVPANHIIIYYFTDRKRLEKMDPKCSHPLTFGPYGTDWGKLKLKILHELGHSLQMRHHFNNRKGSGNIKAHFSPACIMNYKYKSDKFCELCRYALGVETSK